jgi:hypothetical protein
LQFSQRSKARDRLVVVVVVVVVRLLNSMI